VASSYEYKYLYDRWKVRPVFLESEIREKLRAASARAKTIELESVYFTYLSHFISKADNLSAA